MRALSALTAHRTSEPPYPAAVRISPERYRLITVVALGVADRHRHHGRRRTADRFGLGCDDWPNCNDERLIDVSSNHAAIEQVNRLFTGLVALAVIGAVLGSLWRTPRRRDLTWLSLGLVAGVVGQVVLGGITVLVDLHPLAVQGHMLLSMALVATAVVLVRRAGEPDGAPRRTIVGSTAHRLVWAQATATGVAVVTGTVVTGAGPHAGDEDVQRFAVAISSAARLHGITVMIALGLAVALAVLIQRRPADRRALQGPLSSWIFVGLLQTAVGYTQYFNEVPAAARRRPRRWRHGALGDDGVARLTAATAPVTGTASPTARCRRHRLTMSAAPASSAAALLVVTAARRSGGDDGDARRTTSADALAATMCGALRDQTNALGRLANAAVAGIGAKSPEERYAALIAGFDAAAAATRHVQQRCRVACARRSAGGRRAARPSSSTAPSWP